MNAPVIVIEHRELSLDELVENLRQRVAGLPAGSPDSRCAAVLLDVMPGFVAALDRERKLFTAQVRAERNAGTTRNATLDDHLMVMTLPLVNMMGTLIMALVPCLHDEDPCPRCDHLRGAMIEHILMNLERGVRAYVNSAAERGRHDEQRLHS